MVPFVEDIKEINNNILKKNWTKNQLEIIKNTPGMLMINVKFSEFDPQKHEWIYFSLHEENNLKEIENLFRGLAEIVKKGDDNLFEEAFQLKQKQRVKKLANTIEVKPQVKEISINLKEALKLIKEIKKNNKSSN